MKNKVRKSLLWVITLITGYFIISTLYFGYSNINEQKGIYTFYWSGIDAIFRKEKDFGFATDKIVKTELNGADGPYVYSKECYRIDEDGLLRKTIIAKNETLLIETNHPELKGFNVNLRTFHNNEEQIYETPEKLLAISDIEGNFGGFYSFLLANGVIDKNCNWSYGNGHLVLNGDFVDRGKQVTQVLWLIYKLDEQAQDAGGKVHYILGNHEIMMLQGNVSYANFKYIEAAKRISEKSYWDDAMRFLYSEQSELGKWLRTKNIIERIGTTIFVHAGLNIDHAAEKITIQEFNQIARNFYGLTPTSPYANAKERLTLSSISSPYWDRRLAMDLKNKILFLANRIQVKETTLPELDAILNFYQASQIVIGHSIVKDIHTDYAGKIIKIDIKHGEVFKSGTTKGILIENKTAYKVDDMAKKSKL